MSSPSSVEAYATTTPALQQTLLLLRRHPYAALLTFPATTAARNVARILARYPSSTAHRNVQSALRAHGHPVVRVIVFPPAAGVVPVLLLANTPPDQREAWQLALHPTAPLTVGAYELATVAELQREADQHRKPQPRRASDAARLTWRLSAAKRDDYRTQITRTLHSAVPRSGADRDGGARSGTTRMPAGQRARLERLGLHLSSYPGFTGVNVDRWLLQLHAQRGWRRQHGKLQPPKWPRYPYLRALPVLRVPLAELLAAQEAQEAACKA